MKSKIKMKLVDFGNVYIKLCKKLKKLNYTFFCFPCFKTSYSVFVDKSEQEVSDVFY